MSIPPPRTSAISSLTGYERCCVPRLRTGTDSLNLEYQSWGLRLAAAAEGVLPSCHNHTLVPVIHSGGTETEPTLPLTAAAAAAAAEGRGTELRWRKKKKKTKSRDRRWRRRQGRPRRFAHCCQMRGIYQILLLHDRHNILPVGAYLYVLIGPDNSSRSPNPRSSRSSRHLGSSSTYGHVKITVGL